MATFLNTHCLFSSCEGKFKPKQIRLLFQESFYQTSSITNFMQQNKMLQQQVYI